MSLIHILEMPQYKPGDPAPEGYLQWHEWAEVQHKAGLRQKECGRCGKWCYPQQLSAITDTYEAWGRRGKVTQVTAVCNDCADKKNGKVAQTPPPNT